jgi:hypothetical protein
MSQVRESCTYINTQSHQYFEFLATNSGSPHNGTFVHHLYILHYKYFSVPFLDFTIPMLTLPNMGTDGPNDEYALDQVNYFDFPIYCLAKCECWQSDCVLSQSRLYLTHINLASPTYTPPFLCFNLSTLLCFSICIFILCSSLPSIEKECNRPNIYVPTLTWPQWTNSQMIGITPSDRGASFEKAAGLKSRSVSPQDWHASTTVTSMLSLPEHNQPKIHEG